MTNDWYTADKSHVLKAIKMGAFRNSDAKLEAAHVQKMNQLITQRLFEPIELAEPTGEGATFLPKFRSTRFLPGRYNEILYFQTGMQLYPSMGLCTTSSTGAEITTVLCLAKASCVAESTFHFWVNDGDGTETEYYVWLNVAGTDSDPGEAGTAIEADISGATTAIDVAEVIDDLIAAKANVGAENSGTATVTITNGNNGAVTDCCSSEGLDTGFTITITTQGADTHTMAIRTTQTPRNMGRHLERENTTDAESERIDIFGMLCNSHHIECSEASPTAVQSLDWTVAFTKNTSTDDIASNICDDEPFKWKHFTFPTFTYNSETIEATIIGWALDIQNTIRLTTLDSTGYYTIGRYIPLTYITVTLQIQPYGHNAFELIRTALESYATDLDLTVVATRTATIDKVTFTHDKLYCTPFDIAQSKTAGAVESYFLRMHQLNTGSFVPVAVDKYVDDYYET